jgi:hypothetical protein
LARSPDAHAKPQPINPIDHAGPLIGKPPNARDRGRAGAANAFAGQHASDFLIGKTLSRDNIDQAATLLSETTECLSDRYASAEYRANLIRVETRRALFALSS